MEHAKQKSYRTIIFSCYRDHHIGSCRRSSIRRHFSARLLHLFETIVVDHHDARLLFYSDRDYSDNYPQFNYNELPDDQHQFEPDDLSDN